MLRPNRLSYFRTKESLKAKNALINLPYVKDGDLLVSQSNACTAYLGRKLGMWYVFFLSCMIFGPYSKVLGVTVMASVFELSCGGRKTLTVELT